MSAPTPGTVLKLNRQQLTSFLGNNEQLIKTFEALFDQVNAADLPVQPLTAQISANTTYILPFTSAGIQSIYIPAAYLVAASGGPYTLTIQAGSGTVVTVPISAAGTTVPQALAFNVYCDGAGNLVTVDMPLYTTSASGSAVRFSDGTMIQWGGSGPYSLNNAVGTTNYASAGIGGTFPIAFVGSAPIFTPDSSGPANYWSWAANNGVVSLSGFTGQILVAPYASAGAATAYLNWFAVGRWK